MINLYIMWENKIISWSLLNFISKWQPKVFKNTLRAPTPRWLGFKLNYCCFWTTCNFYESVFCNHSFKKIMCIFSNVTLAYFSSVTINRLHSYVYWHYIFIALIHIMKQQYCCPVLHLSITHIIGEGSIVLMADIG